MITIKLKKIAPACMAILFLLGGCKKSPLDQAPQLDLNEEKAFSQILLTERFVNDIYSSMHNEFRPSFMGSFAMEATITDEADQSYQWTGAEEWQKGSWGPTSGSVNGVWNDYYRGIRKTNLLLENVDKTVDNNTTDALTPERLKGEGFFLRALFHFELAKRFGGIPVVTKSLDPNGDLKDANTRKTFAEVVAQIVKDCDAGAALLPVVYTNETLIGRATKAACLALKARALLYLASPLNNPSNDKALWTNAATAAKAVLDLNAFSLPPTYAEVFTKPFNSELIFFRSPPNSSEWMTYNTPPGSRYGGWGGTCPTQNFVDKYEMKNGKPITDPTSGYIEAKPYTDRDPRFYASILYNGNNWAGKILETNMAGIEGVGAGGDNSRTGYYIRKFMNEDAVKQKFGNPTSSWPYFRLAETYLNYAEAVNEDQGPTTEVYTAIKRVRNRAGMPDFPPDLSQAQMRERIRNERAIELIFEAHRFWDVRRWKIAESTVGMPIKGVKITGTSPNWNYEKYDIESRVFAPKMYLWPIPQGEINKNQGLVQNTGW